MSIDEKTKMLLEDPDRVAVARQEYLEELCGRYTDMDMSVDTSMCLMVNIAFFGYELMNAREEEREKVFNLYLDDLQKQIVGAIDSQDPFLKDYFLAFYEIARNKEDLVKNLGESFPSEMEHAREYIAEDYPEYGKMSDTDVFEHLMAKYIVDED